MLTNLYCVSCNKELQDAILDSTFYPNLFTVILPFIAITAIVLVISMISLLSKRQQRAQKYSTPFITAALVLGMGIGGFIDGIVLHQILQWHEMLSHKLPPNTLINKSVNMFWDGIFHLFTLLTVVIGTGLLWRAMRRPGQYSGRVLTGGMLLGWAIFNIVEGVIDHHILKLHLVREIAANPDLWNYAFDIASVVLGIAGYAIVKTGARHAAHK